MMLNECTSDEQRSLITTWYKLAIIIRDGFCVPCRLRGGLAFVQGLLLSSSREEMHYVAPCLCLMYLL
jgi:hypothetical protein